MRAIGSLMLVALVGGGALRAQTADLGPTVSVFAAGVNGPGWWGLKIDQSWKLEASVADRSGNKVLRTLEGSERDQLSRLVDRLPKARQRYSFGKAYVDISIDIELVVGSGKSARKYVVTNYLEDRDAGPELQALLEVLRFLHSLLGSKAALPPPPVNWRARQ